MKLVYDDGREVAVGDNVEISGTDYKVLFIVHPWKPSSSGRVGVKSDTGQFSRYLPCVIGAHWVESRTNMLKFIVNITTYQMLVVNAADEDDAEYQARNIQDVDLPILLDRDYEVVPLDENEEPI